MKNTLLYFSLFRLRCMSDVTPSVTITVFHIEKSSECQLLKTSVASLHKQSSSYKMSKTRQVSAVFQERKGRFLKCDWVTLKGPPTRSFTGSRHESHPNPQKTSRSAPNVASRLRAELKPLVSLFSVWQLKKEFGETTAYNRALIETSEDTIQENKTGN
ncbi:uncharacterized protein V6R79_016757 [Siganus canaliculatus]